MPTKSLWPILSVLVLVVVDLVVVFRIPTPNANKQADQVSEPSVEVIEKSPAPEVVTVTPDSNPASESVDDTSKTEEDYECEKVTSADIYTKRGEIMLRSIAEENGEEHRYSYLCNLVKVTVKVGDKLDGTYVVVGDVGTDTETAGDGEEYYEADTLTILVKTAAMKNEWENRINRAITIHRGPPNVLPRFKEPPKPQPKEE